MLDKAHSSEGDQARTNDTGDKPHSALDNALENSSETGEMARPEPDNMSTVYSVFSAKTKVFVILMTVFGTSFSPLSAFVYLPAITPIAKDYNRSIADINLTVTLYQAMQAVAPLFFGDLSDQIGRRPVYLTTFLIYIGANVGLALQDNYAALMVLRAMQSTGSSATVAIGSAVIGDLTTSADRGGYIAAVQASVQFAPALAPAIGGLLSQYLGWRSTFWFLVILTSVFLVIYIPFVPETARKVVGNGSIPPPKLNQSFMSTRLHRNWAVPTTGNEACTRQQPAVPARIRRKVPIPNVCAAIRIVFEKDIGPLMIFMSLFVMANYAVLVPLQDVIRHRYNFNDVQVGLCYIPYAVGSLIGTIVVGRVLDWYYAHVAKSIGVLPDQVKGDDLRNFPIEKARLDIMWPCLALALAAVASWGWVVDSGTSLAAPLVVLFFAGLGLAGPVSILSTLMIDLYPMNPGRVSSCFNLTRASFSALGTAVVQHIIDAWGYGWTYVFMASVVLSASPVIWMVRRRGPKWREERYQRFHKGRTQK